MEKIIQLIKERQNFVLSGHIGPDGDCIGSCFGLAFALEQLGKNVTVVLEPYPQIYDIIPGKEFLYTGDLAALDVDVFIALDCADVGRLGIAQPLFKRAKRTICIDHHKTNTGFAHRNLIEAEASSTSEIVYRIVEQLVKPTAEIATAIYAGIVSDTGGFKYSATAPSTLEITAKLISTGIPFTEIYNEMLFTHSFAAGKARGIALGNARQAMDGRITYSHVTQEEMASVGATVSDMEGNVEYLLTTRGTISSFFAYEKKTPGQVKISFRSHGPDVSNVAIAMGGGGHQLAAAGTVEEKLEAVVQQALQLLEKEIADYDMRT